MISGDRRSGEHGILVHHLHPLGFESLSSTGESSVYSQDPLIRLLVEFFQDKGLAALKQEDRSEGGYSDWMIYQAKHGIYAALLSPRAYSSLGHSFSLLRLVRFLEVFAFFSPAHAYSLHVSFLGLSPILMSSNESLKKEAIARLENGGLFAFGVSERNHGSDLLSNEFAVSRSGEGWRADGTKSYIGNADHASMISILARNREGGSSGRAGRMPLAFFVLRPGATKALHHVRKIHTLGIRTAGVCEFEVSNHVFPEADMISQGRKAWDAVLSTVNVGKLFLGFGAIGICEHASVEAISHLRRRILYGKPVIEMAHIKAATTHAFARLTAMKLYAYRALDYVQASDPTEQRHVLFNAVQKATVSTEGVKVMALLSECMGARGFEADTYFESALRDVLLIPGLEGSTHINLRLSTQFMEAYFHNPVEAQAPCPPASSLETQTAESLRWMESCVHDRHVVRFAHFLNAYEAFQSLPNVRIFMKQAEAFRRIVGDGDPGLSSSKDLRVLLGTGKCFSVIVYAQLVAENCRSAGVERSMVSLLFHGLIEDLTAASLQLMALLPDGGQHWRKSRDAIVVPRTTDAEFEDAFRFMMARHAA